MIYPYTKPIFRDKGLTQTRNKLTDDKIDCVLEKGNSKKNFKYYLKVHLCRYENLAIHLSSYKKIVGYFLAEGIKGKVDVLMISETKIDETFRSRQFYIEGFTHLTGLIETWNYNTNYIVRIIVP